MNMQTILVATDFSETSQAALELGTTIARDTGARLLIVHVDSPEVAYGGDELDLVVQPLENAVSKQMLEQVVPADASISFEHELLTGSAAVEIVRLAEQRRVDLIVIGTHGRSGPLRFLLGSVAEWVVRHAVCPVLTVKADYRQRMPQEDAS